MHISNTKVRTFNCENGCGTLIVTKHRTKKILPAMRKGEKGRNGKGLEEK